MIDVLNRHWGGSVIETAKGGQTHGGSTLTARGRALLAAYRELDGELHSAAKKHASALIRLVGCDDTGKAL